MGADQSSVPGSSEAGLKSQRDEDIPYTSYSISRPIDNQTPKHSSSPRLDYRPKYTQQQQPSKNRLNVNTGDTAQHDIVVVAEGHIEEEDEHDEVEQLEDIAVFLPIMRESLNLPSVKDTSNIQDKIDAKHVMLLCIRYQEHLRHCAEAIAFDQNALCVRIKEIDFSVQTMYNLFVERQKKFGRHAEQVKKAHEISSVLTRVNGNIQGLIHLMDRLNSLLPAEDQLEPFVLKPTK